MLAWLAIALIFGVLLFIIAAVWWQVDMWPDRWPWRLKKANRPSITCPACGLTSYNPTDVTLGYCGNCYEYTSEP